MWQIGIITAYSFADTNTAEKLKRFIEISKDAEEMEVWLTTTISENNKSLSLLRQKHAVNGGKHI
jgi:hypothetical protein